MEQLHRDQQARLDIGLLTKLGPKTPEMATPKDGVFSHQVPQDSAWGIVGQHHIGRSYLLDAPQLPALFRLEFSEGMVRTLSP